MLMEDFCLHLNWEYNTTSTPKLEKSHLPQLQSVLNFHQEVAICLSS